MTAAWLPVPPLDKEEASFSLGVSTNLRAALVGYSNLSIAPYFLVLVNCGDETTGAFALRVHPFLLHR